MERRRQNAPEGLGHTARRPEVLDHALDQQRRRPPQSRRVQRMAAALLAGVMVTTAGIEPWLGIPAAWAQSPAEKTKKEKPKGKGKPKGDTKAPAKKDAKEGKEPKEAPLSEADLKKARESYAAGEQKFKAADYAGALAEFKVAHSVKATPNTARYLGLCADNLQMPQEAVAAYEAFLANVPPRFADEADEIRGRVAQLRTRPAIITLVTNPLGSDILVDGKLHPSKTPTQVELSPGKHDLVIAQTGFVSQNKEVDVQFGAREEWKVELEKQPAPPPGTVVADTQPKAPVAPVEQAPAVVPPPPPPKRSKTPAYITGGLAIASAGIGTFFGLQALKAQSDFKANPTLTGANSGENKALIADMAFGVAVTLGVTSVVLLTAKNEAAASAPTEAPKPQASNRGGITVHPVPVLYPSGGGAGAVVRF